MMLSRWRSLEMIEGYNGCRLWDTLKISYYTISFHYDCDDMQWYHRGISSNTGLNTIHCLQSRSCRCFGTGTPWECRGEESDEGGAIDHTMYSMIGVLGVTWYVLIWLLILGIKNPMWVLFLWLPCPAVSFMSTWWIMMDHDGDILNRRSAYRGHRNDVYQNRVPKKNLRIDRSIIFHHFPIFYGCLEVMLV